MFVASGTFGGKETRVEVAGWGATTRRGGRLVMVIMLVMMFHRDNDEDDVDVDGDDILLFTGRPTYFSGWRFLQYLATGEKYPIYQNSCVSIVFGH